MSDKTPHSRNGFDKGGGVEALRIQVVTWTQGHEELSDERDRRYDERDRRYEDRFTKEDGDISALGRQLEERFRQSEAAVDKAFKASEIAIDKALASQKGMVDSAFAAAKEALDKAARAIADHFEITNRYQIRLDEQARDMATKGYVQSEIKTVLEKLDIANGEIRTLRESRSQGEGRATQVIENRQYTQWSASTLIAASLGIVGILVAIIVPVLTYIATH